MSEVVEDLLDMIRKEPNRSGSNEDWLGLGNGMVILAYEWMVKMQRIKLSQDDKSILKKLPTNVPSNNSPDIHIQITYHGVFLSASEVFDCEQNLPILIVHYSRSF